MADGMDDPGLFGRSSGGFARGTASGRGRGGIQPEAVPARATRSRAARNGFVVFGNAVIWFLFLGIFCAAGSAIYGSRLYEAKGPLTEEKTVLIAKGSDIADTLQRQSVIDNTFLFSNATWALGKSKLLKAGEYKFKVGISMHEVVDILVEGKGIQHSITIPEGLTSQMIIDRVSQDDVLVGEAPPPPREGSLLPDTYLFERGTSRAQMVARMQAAQKQLLDEVWKARSPNLPLKSPSELVTLASIVEKETGEAEERPHVASVFVNRLLKNMRLQSDPTVIYGIAGGKGKLDRSILKTDLEQSTPYNTYVIPGLPPGPIANPGRAAMQAVASPLQTKDLYFVADGSGGHAFAETLEQHNKNVALWRKAEQAKQTPGDATPDPAAPNTPPATPDATPAVPVVPAAPAPAAGADPAAPGTPPAKCKNKKKCFIDPVEGTKRDPLQNKTFGLDSPQTLPKTQ